MYTHVLLTLLFLFQFGKNCLHSSCERCNPDIISFFMSKGVLDINATNHVSNNNYCVVVLLVVYCT